MADIAYTRAQGAGAAAGDAGPRRQILTWAPIANADTTAPAQLPGNASDIIAQATGTPGGSTLTLQGTIDGGTTWHTVRDIDGADVAFTAAGHKVVRDCWDQVRWSISGGATSSWIATLSVGRIA